MRLNRSLRSGASSAAAQSFSRRDFFKGISAASIFSFLPASPALAPRGTGGSGKKLQVAVVGAGAFGAFAALSLRRGGARVTLLDSWGPGNARASSGGETRVIRGVYGSARIYVEMVARAFMLWRENEARWKRKLYHPTGAIWMVGESGDFVRASLPVLRDFGFPFEELSTQEAAKRYPQVDFQGVLWVLKERRAGYLLARQACAAAVEGFVSEGGKYRQAAVEPGEILVGAMEPIRLSDGSTLAADAYVFACGPWLGKIFPEVLGNLIRPTRQDVFFFGTPPGDARFSEAKLPVWVDFGGKLIYGIPGNERRGFKVADDTRGVSFDPTNGERTPSAEALKSARDFLARRFPALAGAPLLESRVCQYENTPDQHFILDRHPAAENVWLVGGGSGHGFKFGPAWGERVAETVTGKRKIDPFFALSRFSKGGSA